MVTDALDGLQQMKEINISTLPRLQVRFDPNVWRRDNPMGHPEVYALDRDQLEVWGGEVTQVRKQFMRKAELYETYSSTVKKVNEKKTSRRSFPHSTIDNNKEGLLEVQIKQRVQSQSGFHVRGKKRTFKQVPPQTRDDIARMYLVQHVFQKDIAQYYRIS